MEKLKHEVYKALLVKIEAPQTHKHQSLGQFSGARY